MPIQHINNGESGFSVRSKLNNVIDIANNTLQVNRYDQTSPSASWNITHSLGRIPKIDVYDSNGELIEGDVFVTQTNITIVFANPITGFIIYT